MKVTTYRLAYLNRDVTLCDYCAGAYPDTLGPVNHGAHDGDCEQCDAPLTFTNPRCEATIEDWPSGRKRVTARFWVERNPKRGERLVRQTTGKPKLQTYSRRVAIVDGSDGRTYALEETTYGFVTIVSGTLQNFETVHSSSDPIRHAALVQLISQREGDPR